MSRNKEYLITDISRLRDVLDDVKRSESFSVSIPYTTRNFSAIERMILSRTESGDVRGRWQSIADSFRVGSKWALLAPGFATDTHRASLERGEVGLLVRFNKR